MFKDVEMKIAFHKERIVKELIRKGVAPESSVVQSRLDNIDAFLAIFKHEQQQEGKTFNASAFNSGLKAIHQDLVFLYALLQDFTTKELYSLKAFADTHLDELEDTARYYELKAVEEANSTSLGKTILFQHGGFDISTHNNIVSVDLGTIEVNEGSKIACIANINNIEADKVLFGLQRDGEIAKYVAAYNYNQDALTVSGELEVKTHLTTIENDQVVSGPVAMNLDDTVSRESWYIILAGKGKILAKAVDSLGYTLYEKPTPLNMASFPERSYIDFYVVGGNKITFRFNKMPIQANFPLDDYVVSWLKHIHHFFMECEPGFSFDFELDRGEVYAVKENGIVDGDKLLFSRSIDVRDFLVEEYKTGEKVTCRAFLKIINDDAAPAQIESITIKELSLLGGIE